MKIFMAGRKKRVITVLVIIFLAVAVSIGVFFLPERAKHEKSVIWNGNDGYQYRIPGIVCTDNGLLIAYCEKRRGLSDWSVIDIVIKVSKDFGKTWTDEKVLVDGITQGKTVNNPVMIADGDTIHFLYCIEYGLTSKMGGVYYCYSSDGANTWSKPVRILHEGKYNVIATGPGHGILSKAGRLIVPVWYVRTDAGMAVDSHHPGTVATLYSDDHGKTWMLGEEIPAGKVIDPNESSIVELSDGTFLMNIRNQVDYGFKYRKNNDVKTNQDEIIERRRKRYRAVSRSSTGIDRWNEAAYDKSLPDPVCFGSMCRYDRRTILFVNCNSQKKRENLCIRVSQDNGHTWSQGTMIGEVGGYADIAVDNNRNIFCLAEEPRTNDNCKTYYSLTFHRFNIGWVKVKRQK